MVNYKRVVCEVAVLAVVLAVGTAAPAPDCFEERYDQRQNGTENIRVNIDGVVIAISPVDTLLEAVAEFGGLLEESALESFKPPSSVSSTAKPEVNNSDTKPDPEKPAETPISDVSLPTETKAQRKDSSAGRQEKVKRLKQRLANVLIPLLRKTRQQ